MTAWDDAERDRAIAMRQAGAPLAEIARVLGRTLDSVRCRLDKSRRGAVRPSAGLDAVRHVESDTLARVLRERGWKVTAPPKRRGGMSRAPSWLFEAVQVEADLVQCVGPMSASCEDAIHVDAWRGHKLVDAEPVSVGNVIML